MSKHEVVSPEQDSASQQRSTKSVVPWNPWVGVILILLIYFLSRYVGSIFVLFTGIVPYFMHGSAYASNWLENSVAAQFLYVIFAEAFTVGSIYAFLRHYKLDFRSIGLHRPRWRDPVYGLLTIPFYLVTYIAAVDIVSQLVHGFNVNQQQQIGFSSVHGPAQLIMTAISLVILPPIAEEIMFRGFLYSSLKKGMPVLASAVVTSVLFASAHLAEGGSSGPLWIAALDTFILSLFLVLLRERTKNLWASMTLHATKNGIAYYALFIAPLVHFR